MACDRTTQQSPEAALKSGRIVQADRDKRVDELRNAQTMQDIDLVIRDIRLAAGQATVGAMSSPAANAPSQAAGQPGQQPWPLVNYGPQPGSTHTVDLTQFTRAGSKIGGIIAAVVLVSFVIPIAGVIIAFVSARDSLPGPFGAPSDETTYLPGQDPAEGGINLHTVAGYEALQDALREETGSTEVYEVVLYPRYAGMEVPVGRDASTRYQNFYYDGELQTQDIKGTTTYARFDLEDIDPELMIRLLKEVRAAVEDPVSWYVVASAPTGAVEQLSAYASNEFGESEYKVVGFDGNVIYDTTTN